MKKIVYTRPDGGVSVIIPASKESLEKSLGTLTVLEYEDHVRSRSIPGDAINVRSIDDVDLPSREFRNAWEDTQVGTQIDISCEKAKDIKLGKMRAERDNLLEAQDKISIIALENGDSLVDIKAEKQRLRDSTNGLVALDVVGKFNDEVIFQSIRDLSIM